MWALKIIALPSAASPGYTSYYKYIRSIDLGIVTGAAKATKVTRVTRAARVTNSLGIPIKLGFSFLLSLIGTSTFLRCLD